MSGAVATPDPPPPPIIGGRAVIDVGTPVPNAQPGQMGSQVRPIQIGPEARPGGAMPAQAIPQQTAPAPAPTPSSQAGYSGPTALEVLNSDSSKPPKRGELAPDPMESYQPRTAPIPRAPDPAENYQPPQQQPQ